MSEPSILVALWCGKQSAQNGRQSGNLFFGDSQAFKTFERLLWSAAEQYLERLPNDETILTCRSALSLEVFTRGLLYSSVQVIAAHIHPTGWLSGVIIAKLPDVMHAGTSEDGLDRVWCSAA